MRQWLAEVRPALTRSSFGQTLGAELTKSAVRQYVGIAVNREGKMDWTQVAADGFGNSIGNSIVDEMKYNGREDVRLNNAITRLNNRVAVDFIKPAERDALLNNPNVSSKSIEDALNDNTRKLNADGILANLLGDEADKVRTSTLLPPDKMKAFVEAGLYDATSGNIKAGMEKGFWAMAQEMNLQRAVSVNGILNSYADAQGLGKEVAQMSGKIVTQVYNPTSSAVMDVLQTAGEIIQGFKDPTYAKLNSTITEALAFNRTGNKNATLTVLGHSQGSVLANDVVGNIAVSDRKSIDLVNLATATPYVPSGLHSYRGFVNLIDPIPYLTGGISTLATAQFRSNYSVTALLFPGPAFDHGVAGYLQEPTVYNKLGWNAPVKNQE